MTHQQADFLARAIIVFLFLVALLFTGLAAMITPY